MPIKLTSYYKGKDIPDLPGNNTFHSKEMFLLYEATPHYKPIFIVATDGDKPVAKLLATIRRNIQFFPSPFFKRCDVYGTGEYLDNNIINKEEIFEHILKYLTQEVSRSTFIIEFRNLDNALTGYKHFRANKFFAVNWLRVQNSLHRTDKIEEQFSSSRIRQIKKGLKNGAEVCEATTTDEIKEFSRMLHKIYSFRIRKYFPTNDFFQLSKSYLIDNGLAKIFIVKYKGKIIGGATTIYSGENAYLWFSGGMTKRYASLYPGVLAVWAALSDAKSRGFRHLEFMDVGLPFREHGYRNFVLRFGGKQSSTRRWFRIRWRFINNIFIKLYA